MLNDGDDEKDDLTAETTRYLNLITNREKKTYADQEDVLPEMMNGDLADKLLAAYQDDDDDDDFDLEDEDDFEVKTDQIDEVIFFCEAFSGFAQREPQVYEALVKVLSDAEKEKLTQLAQEANKRVLANQNKANKST